MDIRLLKASEIDVRVQSVKKTKDKVGCILLLYKDARVDQKILDETFSPMGWQRDHKELKGNIYCGIGVYDDKSHQWIWKWDCGSESNTEKEKGEASDSFKRAGFNWGIGRELYSSPFIWVNLEESEWYEKGDKIFASASLKFSVKSISYNSDREITALEIEDNRHQVRFTLGKAPKEDLPKATIDAFTAKQLEELMKRKGDAATKLLNKYKVKKLTDLTIEQYTAAKSYYDGLADVAS